MGRRGRLSTERKLLDLWRCPPKVAVPDPRRLRPHVHQARPSLAVAAIGERGEVDLLQALQLFALWEVRQALVLNRALVPVDPPADNERDPGIAAQMERLPRGVEGIEDDLELIADGETDEG